MLTARQLEQLYLLVHQLIKGFQQLAKESRYQLCL
jgi:hypothetical protein